MAFKLNPPYSTDNIPVYHVDMEDGVAGKANNNGTIIDPHSKESARIIKRDLSKWLSNSNCWMVLLIKD